MATKEEVLKISNLARLSIPESEVEGIQKKFSNILAAFEFLKDAKTGGVEPLFHGIDEMELRDDVPESPLDRELLLKNAPDQMEHCFRIPKVVGAERA